MFSCFEPVVRKFLRAVVCCSLPLLAATAVGEVNGSAQPWNVLFINFDDMRPEIGAYGNTEVITPNLDALAADGAVFEQAFCQQAVCTPSRNSFLSGRRPESSGLTAFTDQVRDKLPNAVTLPQLFKNAGYQARSYGKVFHSRDAVSWSVPEFVPAPDPYYPIYLDPVNRANQQAEYDAGHKISLESTWYNGIYQDFIVKAASNEAADVDDFQYYDGRTTQQVLDFLDNPGDAPFFLAVGFYKPHLPFSAPKKYWDLYDPESLTLLDVPRPAGTPSLNVAGTTELTAYLDQDYPDAAERRHLVHGYYACISYVDTLVGRIITKLKEKGLYENTIIVAFSDHGYHLGEHAMWSKTTNWELTTRVPLFLRLPYMEERGVQVPAMVELIDVYPTLAQAAGLNADDSIEGTSLLPLVANPQTEWKSAVTSFFPRSGFDGYSLRTEQYRFNEWRKGTSVQRELFDHEADPHETVNLALDSSYNGLMDALSADIDAGGEAHRPPLYFDNLPKGFAFAGEDYSSTVQLGGALAVSEIRALRLPPGWTLTDHGDGSATLSGQAPDLKGVYPIYLEAGDPDAPVSVHHYLRVGKASDAAALGYWRFEEGSASFDSSLMSTALEPAGGLTTADPASFGFPAELSEPGVTNTGALALSGSDPLISAILSDADVSSGFSVEAWVYPTSAAGSVQTIAAQFEQTADPARKVDWSRYPILPYSDQDVSGTCEISGEGSVIALTGNRWKRIDFPMTVTAGTVLEFDVTVVDAGEITAIGFETDNDQSNDKLMFQIAGSDVWPKAYGSADGVAQYSGSGVQHMEIPVGQFYQQAIASLAIACDDDADASADARFENIVIRQTDQDGRSWRFIRNADGKLAFEALNQSEQVVQVESSFVLSAGAPRFVAATYDPQSDEMVFLASDSDGQLVSEAVSVPSLPDSLIGFGDLTVGSSLSDGLSVDTWTGGVDELRLTAWPLPKVELLGRSLPDFEAWLGDAGVPSELQGKLDDPDGDGRSNYEEFLTGGDPMFAEAAAVEFAQIASSADAHAFTLRFPWSDLTGSIFYAEASSNLSEWTRVLAKEAWISQIDTIPGYGVDPRMRIELSVESPNDYARRFYRIGMAGSAN
ncbi:sulfatase-like hydrolase/transferase [Coraliomargarita parva]|uniref:sulfatase-like hydrolase/transferase n=1 Tax=Coraliomargarita parva TaxID=3014050 RepID=UPI0022B50C7C|nr:sulfatase-like hydrolase/transferase [Coraliomargarita parva]